MRGLNKVMLIGRLGKDPDMVYFEGSDTVKASFTLATNEVYKDRDGNKIEKTDWHNVVMWRGLARVAEKYLHKGSLVYVEGKLKTRSWEDSNNQKRYITEIEVSELQMLDRRPQDGQQQGPPRAQPTIVSSGAVHQQQKTETAQAASPPIVKEDLPF